MILLLILPLGFIILLGVKVIDQYERGVVLTLGRYSGTREPGLTWIMPIFQRMMKVDLRVDTVDIPQQEVITKDNVTLGINAVVYFRVDDSQKAIIKIEDYEYAVKQYTQAALRDVIGNAELDVVLTEREKIANNIKKIVDSEISGWGVDIESIKIQEIELPPEMKRAMAKQAEAEREKRSTIIVAEGELKASENLRKAGETLARSPAALHLRTLQTIRDIASSPSEKIVLFMPGDIGETLKKVLK